MGRRGKSAKPEGRGGVAPANEVGKRVGHGLDALGSSDVGDLTQGLDAVAEVAAKLPSERASKQTLIQGDRPSVIVKGNVFEGAAPEHMSVELHLTVAEYDSIKIHGNTFRADPDSRTIAEAGEAASFPGGGD